MVFLEHLAQVIHIAVSIKPRDGLLDDCAAKADAERALALNDASPEAHIALGEVHRFFEWDWKAAEQAYRRAIDLAPNHAVAHHWYAMLLATLAR